jgi:hypothetical protein
MLRYTLKVVSFELRVYSHPISCCTGKALAVTIGHVIPSGMVFTPSAAVRMRFTATALFFGHKHTLERAPSVSRANFYVIPPYVSTLPSLPPSPHSLTHSRPSTPAIEPMRLTLACESLTTKVPIDLIVSVSFMCLQVCKWL